MEMRTHQVGGMSRCCTMDYELSADDESERFRC